MDSVDRHFHIFVRNLEDLQRLRTIVLGARLEAGNVQRQIISGEQVKGAAHPPGLDQGSVFSNGPSHVLYSQAIYPVGQRDLRARHHLRVHSAELSGSVQHPLFGQAVGQPLPVEPPGAHGVPAERGY